MIKQLHQLAQVQNALQNSSKTTQFNATLPIKLEVMEKLQGIRYMLKVGNAAMETKSLKELQVGSKYWAMMGRGSTGSITLSNLIKQPNLLKDSNIPLKLNEKTLEQFLQNSENPFDVMKGFLTDRLANAESKWEFAFLSHMLMSIKHKVLTIPLHYDDASKDGFMQLRKKRLQEQECLEFYSVFSNLGATWGLLWDFKEGVRLDISVMYESVANLLRRNLDSLAFIKETHININSDIVPLYEFSDSLLDLEG
ncbi:hypothetical protein [Helicobacter turcicus]|uniref:Uncharacterized protein n=1 Tax=Helicobacter turcicus TaxID=2867412 RepID=A0ABS7JMH4_9HELI|nr:hypothetical protein [Helicobacter turcicus]MBX7490580.1 hypothetical protein [Helicobacter turcicus]MBX7545510.1 hypothetical protein [Helicobacter turcicus]